MRGDHVVKPRTLLWEQLLLSSKSPLRRTLRELAASSHSGAEAFEFLPTLGFKRASARAGGEVERVQLAPLRVRSAEQLERLTGLPVLATVPYYATPQDRRRGQLQNLVLALILVAVVVSYLTLFVLKLKGAA